MTGGRSTTKPAGRASKHWIDLVTAPLWSAGFRAFFWLAALNVVASLATWVAFLSGAAIPVQGWPPQSLHAHEMIYGTVVPVIAGFLLTAVPNWTSTPPLRGRPVMALVALWFAGRMALALGDFLPREAVLVIDVAFLPVLAAVVGVPIVRARKPRNLPVVALLLGLALANFAMHRGLIAHDALLMRNGAIASVYLAIFLVLLISGRIVPLFTRNALRKSGLSAAVEPNTTVGALALTAAGFAFVFDLASPGSVPGAWMALVTAPLLIARQLFWGPAYTAGRPILWVLHAGHAWIAVGFACQAAAVLWSAIPLSSALHAFTAGALGCIMLGMMTRVSLGHTGRPVKASALTIVAYTCVIGAAGVRVFGGALAPAMLLEVYQLSGVAFALGYAIFAAEFTPVLWGGRADG